MIFTNVNIIYQQAKESMISLNLKIKMRQVCRDSAKKLCFFYKNDCTKKQKEKEKTCNRAPTTIFGVDGGNVRSKINTSQKY